MPLNLPTGSRCFVDANIFYYHFVQTPVLSDLCTLFLERVQMGEITAYTSANAVAEAVHKVMMFEAASKFGLSRANLVAWLQHHGARIAELGSHVSAAGEIGMLRITLLPVDLDILAMAAQVSRSEHLLTNDAITVALMRREGLANLVSNDGDFERVTGITLWKPV